MSRVAVLVAALLACSCVADPAHRVARFETPDPDVAILGNDCLACHTGDLVRQQRLTDKQWAKTVDKMRTWGAPTEPEEVEPLLSQLAAPRPYVPRTLSVEEAASLFERAPDGAFSGGDARRGSALYAERCAACHADDGRGGTMGVALAGRHVLDRAPDLAAAVRAGRGRMPAFESTTDAEVADMVAYLRSL